MRQVLPFLLLSVVTSQLGLFTFYENCSHPNLSFVCYLSEIILFLVFLTASYFTVVSIKRNIPKEFKTVLLIEFLLIFLKCLSLKVSRLTEILPSNAQLFNLNSLWFAYLFLISALGMFSFFLLLRRS